MTRLRDGPNLSMYGGLEVAVFLPCLFWAFVLFFVLLLLLMLIPPRV